MFSEGELRYQVDTDFITEGTMATIFCLNLVAAAGSPDILINELAVNLSVVFNGKAGIYMKHY